MPIFIAKEIPEAEIDDFMLFFEDYKTFMKNEGPIFMESGAHRVTLKAEVNTKINGHNVVWESNRALNARTRDQIRDMTRGFVSGWKARSIYAN